MTLRGGAAEKRGYIYEELWTLLQFARMLRNPSIKTIQVEPPNTHGVDFLVTSAAGKEFHQVKRRHSKGKWSLAALASKDILEVAGHRLAEDEGNKYVFVSGSDAPELSDLCEAVRGAGSFEDFQNGFLPERAKGLNKAFREMREAWGSDEQCTYKYLRRVEVKVNDSDSLMRQLHSEAQALFSSVAEDVIACLERIRKASMYQAITREDLISRLNRDGYRLRQLADPKHAYDVVRKVTDQYLRDVCSRLIRGEIVHRDKPQALLSCPEKGEVDNIVITGDAGSGKTVFVADIVRIMRDREWPVLAFRIDQVPEAINTLSLGKSLGLEDSPSQVLAMAAETVKCPGVLVIDQLDALSAMSGRTSNTFNAIDELLGEVRGLYKRIAVRVIIVCREFDWRHDGQLRQLVPEAESENRIDVPKFPVDTVEKILSGLDCSLASLRPQQLKLLQLPQNLRLFTEVDFGKPDAFAFGTETDLFDKYWDEKRRAIRKGGPLIADQWMEVMKALCEYMTSSQRLSAPREILDDFSPDYRDSLVSEGVLVSSGNRYGFGHESFFDYCSARMFSRDTESSLVSLLKETEQHLFWRAQVRQVLTYLRDKDHARYIKETHDLIANKNIRPHIKDLVLALFFKVPVPSEEEWLLFLEWLNPMIEAIKAGELQQNKMMEVIRKKFFLASGGWFEKLDQHKKIEQWLASENDRVADMVVNYSIIFQRDFPDRTAQLLEPYADRGGEWASRFRYLMEWADHGTGREFFELVLRLVANGTLDEARAPIAANGTFWLIFSDLRKNRLDWIPELLACWLQRRFSIFRDAARSWEFFGDDDFAAQLISKSAQRHPDVFVRHILPVVLDTSDAVAIDVEPPKPDNLWTFLVVSNIGPHGPDVCLPELGQALATLANQDAADLPNVIESLRERDTYVSNYLILRLYAGDKGRHADAAVELLCNEPWRLECATGMNRNWHAEEVIRAATPSCTEEHLRRLERMLLSYVPPLEREKEGRVRFGMASFSLLSAIPEHLRSAQVKKRLNELQRKFREPQGKPREFRVQQAISPIPEGKTEHMTNAQWINALKKYDGEAAWNTDGLKGGSLELGRDLESKAKQDPERFARLSLSPEFPVGCLVWVLSALTDAKLEEETLKVQVCQKAFSGLRRSDDRQVSEELGKSIANVLSKAGAQLSDDAVNMLGWLATEHRDPAEEVCRVGADEVPYFGGDIHTHGINSVRGRAAEAIRSLIFFGKGYINRFRPILDRMAEDEHPAALSCVAGTFLAVAKHDRNLSMRLFRKIDLSDGRLFATPDVERLIYTHMKSFNDVRSIIEKALHSSEPDANEVGARLASIAALEDDSASALVDEALRGNDQHRLGIARVAAQNLKGQKHRDWSMRRLKKLMNDDDENVLREVAGCFGHVENHDLSSLEDFIKAFCDSEAFRQNPEALLHALEDAQEQLPKTTCLVCEKFLNRLSEEARDIQTVHAMLVAILTKLVFRSYQQHQNDGEWAPRLLTLIDRLCLERISTDAEKEFALFDR